jgi:outer membrane protein OmpA-like peptidoglycan-associated protein
MSNHKQPTTFKKTLLSIVIISTITGGLIALQRYQSEPEFLPTGNVLPIGGLFEHSLVTTDIEELALIAEANLMSQAQIEAQLDEIDTQPLVAENDITKENIAASIEKNRTSLDIVVSDEAPKVIENRVLFAFDSSQIKPVYLPSLNAIAALIKSAKADHKMVWQVVGYSDQRGNALYNNQLAKTRAQAVAQFLIDQGVDRAQLAVLSLGESETQGDVSNPENNRLARRVEIHAYQAEIEALVAQLVDSTAVPKKLQSTPDKTTENSWSLNKATPQKEAVIFTSAAQPLTTAMDF